MPSSDDANWVTAHIPAGSTLTRLRIAQMDCATEEALIRKKLGGMASVQGLQFNLMQRVLSVVHDSGALAAVEAAIRDLGMNSEAMES
ncbi:MAG: heavy metal translocating P-type ATPase, partial [Candidatus Accumulibacter sp.]|nr:heavy metal translocating P-type ATPase [Accumulibacter sp.]